ncbi:MAG TPA: hypothetical protein VHC72_07975, partial [Bryobacteraceae bacterium]|nr:hypothetical protein [Bryobacteraceae bacterium]
LGLQETFVLETGDVLEFDEQGARHAGRVTVGRVCIDSGAVGEIVGDMVIRDRKVIAEDGIVIPIIAINKHTGGIESTELVSRGFGLEHDPVFMMNARQAVERTLEASSDEEKSDWGVVKEKIRADLKRFINREAQRRPLIMPVILEI